MAAASIRIGENNAPAPAVVEPQFVQELRRSLPSKLYKVGLLTAATAVGGFIQQFFVTPAVSLRILLFLFFTLVGGIGTTYAGIRVEAGRAANPRRREGYGGVAIFASCFLLLLFAGSLVGFESAGLTLDLVF
ncbi:unnamed protein product [Urochloa humidicola]